MATCPFCTLEHPGEFRFCPTTGRAIAAARGGDPLVGTMLDDKYHVDKRLAQGGMGIVYLGTHTLLQRQVAIKILNPYFVGDDALVGRFLREARTAAAVRHDHIVDVMDVGRTPDGLVYIVMEYLDGEDLSSYIARGALPIPAAVDVASQVCEALEVAHAKGVVHRDLKPANIFLVRKPDGRAHVKLLDFGISKMGGEGAHALTGTGEVIGTPLYMSPEQAQSGATRSESDLYSLGVILFEMVTGNVPFTHPERLRVLAMHATELPPSPGALRPDLPPALERVILGLLEKDPADRCPTATALRAALDAIATSGSSGEAPPLDWGPTMVGAPPQPEPAGFAFPATRVIEPSAAPKIPPPGTPVTGPRKKKEPAWLWPGVAAFCGVLVLSIGGIVLSSGPDEAGPSPVVPVRVPAAATSAPSPRTSAPATSAPGTTAAAAAEDEVTVRIVSDPPGATVKDGDVVLGTTPVDLRLERSVAPRNLQITLEGRAPRMRSIVPDRDREIHVELPTFRRRRESGSPAGFKQNPFGP